MASLLSFFIESLIGGCEQEILPDKKPCNFSDIV